MDAAAHGTSTSSSGPRGESNQGGVPPSPRHGTTGGDGAAGEPLDLSNPTEPQTLARLLEDASRLTAASLPPSPTAFAQAPRSFEQPLVLYLCRLWSEAGLTDREWTQALQMYESETVDNQQQSQSGGNPAPEKPRGQVRWSLEIFSMWFLKRGRRLRECQQWFRAFDFDRDDVVCIADFLQGLAAAVAAPPSTGQATPLGLCNALALFRLLDLDNRQSVDVREFEAILTDAQVTLDTGGQMTSAQIAQRATDFDFFRSTVLPRLQGSALRLRVFGAPSADS